jgi:hypothetical protein
VLPDKSQRKEVEHGVIGQSGKKEVGRKKDAGEQKEKNWNEW